MTLLAILFCAGFGLYLLSYVPWKTVKGWAVRFKGWLDNG